MRDCLSGSLPASIRRCNAVLKLPSGSCVQCHHLREVKKNPSTDLKKTQDEFNAVTAVLSSTHDGKHQGYDFIRTSAKLYKPQHIKTFA